MTTVLSPTAKQKFFDNNNPANQYRLFTYKAGTTTKQSTYTDSSGGVTNSNPITLDYRGECDLWIPPNTAYKYVFCRPGADDPPTSSIWTVDNIVNSQLITLYGGVDTGSVNAYILNFTANFTAYADGIVIYWIPANTNTSTSTINVNGLGVVNITNADGSGLSPNQIVASYPTTIIYKSGAFILVTNAITSGSFIGTLSGLTTTVTANIQYTISGNLASLIYRSTGNATGTSNSTTLSITGVPNLLMTGNTLMQGTAYGVMDNGIGGKNAIFTINPPGNSILFALGFDGLTSFTAAGTKGLMKNFNMSYPLL